MKEKGFFKKISIILSVLLCLFTAAPINVSAEAVHPTATGMTITPSNQGSDDTQKIEVAITYDNPIKVSSDAKDDFTVAISGTPYDPSRITVSSDPNDSHKLLIDVMINFAIYGGKLTITPKNSTGITKVTNSDGSASINWTNVDCYIPNGLSLETVSSVPADTSKNVNAKVTKKISSLGKLRAMVHILFLKNGVPVGSLDTFGASVVAHYHTFLTFTGDTFAPVIANALTTAFGNDYTFTTSGSNITAEAKSSITGDTLDIRVFAYPQDRDADKTQLTAELQKAKAYNGKSGIYTSITYNKLMQDITSSETILNEHYTLQADADNMTAALKSDISNLSISLSDSSSGFSIIGQLPEGAAKLSVTASTVSYAALNTYIGNNYSTDLAYNIDVLDASGAKLEPLQDGSVTISIPLPEKLIGNNNLAVFYVDSNGNSTKIASSISADGKILSFVTTHLSQYVIAEKNTAAASTTNTSATALSTSSASNTVANPKTGDTNYIYILYTSILIVLSMAILISIKFIKKRA